MGYAPFTTYNSHSSQVGPQTALFHHPFGVNPIMQSHSSNSMHLPSPIAAAKLPSLEGLLKKMQHEPTSPAAHTSTANSPLAADCAQQQRFYQHQQLHRLSPARREFAQRMPSLRTIISPSVAKSASPLLPSISQPQQQHMPSSFPSRKRSWLEATASTAFRPIKARAVSPASSTSSTSHSASLSTSSSPQQQRSRASKYCKIDGCKRVSQRNNLCHSHGGKRLCKEPQCVSKDRGNGYCIKHGGGKICSIGSCEKKARRKGLCTQHFRMDDNDQEAMAQHDGSEDDSSISSSGRVLDGLAALHYASTM